MGKLLLMLLSLLILFAALCATPRGARAGDVCVAMIESVDAAKPLLAAANRAPSSATRKQYLHAFAVQLEIVIARTEQCLVQETEAGRDTTQLAAALAKFRQERRNLRWVWEE